MKLRLFLIIFLAPIFLGGCIFLLGAGVGAGGYSFIKGELRVSYSVGVRKAYRGTLKALKNLGMKVVEKKVDALGGKIKALRADGTKIRLSLRLEEAGSTSIGVRVGTFGKKKVSEQIHRRIRRSLGR